MWPRHDFLSFSLIPSEQELRTFQHCGSTEPLHCCLKGGGGAFSRLLKSPVLPPLRRLLTTVQGLLFLQHETLNHTGSFKLDEPGLHTIISAAFTSRKSTVDAWSIEYTLTQTSKWKLLWNRLRLEAGLKWADRDRPRHWQTVNQPIGK